MDFIFYMSIFLLGFMSAYAVNFIFPIKRSKKYPKLERTANLILASGSLQEIKDFMKLKAHCLKLETFNKLCDRIQELTADQIIKEDDNILKIRIAELSDKETELKKLQAESFMETLNTLKCMVQGKSR